jgi:hypothetical protein
MKRIATIVCCCLFLVGIAVADAPHFTSLCGTVDSANAVLTVNFKVAGVGNEPVDVTLSDSVDFTCTTKGSGQETSAHQTVRVTKTFTPHNGSFKGSLTFEARCPGTQIESNATFRNVFITVSRDSTTLLRQRVTDADGNLVIDSCQ